MYILYHTFGILSRGFWKSICKQFMNVPGIGISSQPIGCEFCSEKIHRMFTIRNYCSLTFAGEQAKKRLQGVCPLEDFNLTSSHRHSFRPVFRTYEVPRRLGSGRRTLYLLHIRFPSLLITYILYHILLDLSRGLEEFICKQIMNNQKKK